MPIITTDRLNVYYQSIGDESNPTVLMIHGLNTSYLGWPDSLVNAIAQQGFRVITFDNRDVGQTTLNQSLKLPNVPLFLLKQKMGLKPKPPYHLEELALDALSLLDALNIETAHLVGISMGGMIAQLIAINHPQRIKNLTLLSTTSGNPKLPPADKNLLKHIMTSPKVKGKVNAKQIRINHMATSLKIISSPKYPSTNDYFKQRAQDRIEHGMTFHGLMRHILAIVSAPSRVEPLKQLKIPTLVIHGDVDILVKPECGQELGEIIPNADFEMIEGFGHDLPEGLNPYFAERITKHCS